MAQVIMMAEHYQKRPSEIMDIDDPYIAFCFDEVAFLLLNYATDDKGQINWNRIRWKGEKQNSNQEFIDFIKDK